MYNCILGCVVNLQVSEANSWPRSASSNPGNRVCVLFVFLSFIFHTNCSKKIHILKFTFLKAFTSEFKFRTNPVKAFSGMCVRLTSITFPVIWSSVLIPVTREWRYCGLVYKFFLINNIELKCSFVWCRKYHQS